MVHVLRKTMILQISIVSLISHILQAHLLSMTSHCKITEALKNPAHKPNKQLAISCTILCQVVLKTLVGPLHGDCSESQRSWYPREHTIGTGTSWWPHWNKAHRTIQKAQLALYEEEWQKVWTGTQAAHWNRGQVKGTSYRAQLECNAINCALLHSVSCRSIFLHAFKYESKQEKCRTFIKCCTKTARLFSKLQEAGILTNAKTIV